MTDWRKQWGIPLDMVDIYEAGNTILETLKRFYSQYYSSDVVTIRLLNNHLLTFGFGYAIVELRDGRFAEAIVLKRSDEIVYRVVPEKPFSRRQSQLPFVHLEDFHCSVLEEEQKRKILAARDLRMLREQEMQDTPPEQDSSSNILNVLNDHCLQEIFQYLPLTELCLVADVCVKFKRNAEKLFRRFSDSMPEVDDLCLFESLLRNFGNQIKSLSIRGNFSSAPSYFKEKFRTNGLLLILATYCSVSNCQLNKLNFSLFNIEPLWYNLLRSVFVRLKHLRFENSEVGNLLSFCKELTELNLIGDDLEIATPNETLPTNLKKLVKLSIQYAPHDFIHLLTDSEAMKCLKISNDNECCLTINEACSIFPSLEQLELYLAYWVDDLATAVNMKSCLAKMKNLKKLGLGGYCEENFLEGKDFFEILADANVTVEWLVINMPCPRALDSIPKLKQSIQILEFHIYRSPIDDLVGLVKNLPHLKELRVHLFGAHQFDNTGVKEIVKYAEQLSLLYIGEWDDCAIKNDNFNELLELIKKRKQKIKLKIEICSLDIDLLQVAKDIMKKNFGLLEIKCFQDIGGTAFF